MRYSLPLSNISLISNSYFFRLMDRKWQEKLEKDEDEFANYSKGKYFADKYFFQEIAAGKYFEHETTSENVKKISEPSTKSRADPAGYSNEKGVGPKTAKEKTTNNPNGEQSSKKSA